MRNDTIAMKIMVIYLILINVSIRMWFILLYYAILYVSN